MKRLVLALFPALFGVALLGPAGSAAPSGEAGVTFIVTSDSHYVSSRNLERIDRNKVTIERMNAIAGTPWPEKLGGGKVGTPRGVLALGDLIDDGDKQDETPVQWRHFEKQFGLDGTDGLLKYPVYEGWGNHDGPPIGKEKFGFSVQAKLKERTALRKKAGRIANVSENGMHYSWDWDKVHFVQANLYPADKQHPKVRYSLPWHDPQGALAFVKDDLKASVGDSGRPVVVMSHCGVDTDWDVYSLGATLYELLTGRPPFGGKPVGELLRDIQAGAFDPPRVAAGWVPKPLDAVVRKAMSLRPEDRYTTALDLAADVERYLADEPVQAHRETPVERARRWAKRHPVLVRTVVAVLLLGTPALALGLGVVYFQNRKIAVAERLKGEALKREEAAHAGERKARDRVERLLDVETRGLEQVRATLDLTTDELVGTVLAKQTKLGLDERAFLEKLVDGYARFAAGDAGTPAKRLLAAQARLRVGALRERLGDNPRATADYGAARAALSDIPIAGDTDPRRDLGTACLWYARTALAVDARAATAALEVGLRIRLSALEAAPNDPDKLRDNGLAMLQGAELLLASGHIATAEDLYRRFLKVYQPVALAGVLGPDLLEAVAQAYDQLSLLHAKKAPPRYDLAYAELDGAVILFGRLERRHPGEPRYRHRRASARVAQVGLLHRDGKAAEAEEVIAPLVDDYRELVRGFPAVREYRQGHASALTIQAVVLTSRGKLTDVARALDEARGALTRLHNDYPEFGEYREHLIAVLRELARTNRTLGRGTAATGAEDEANSLAGESSKK